MGKSVHLTPPKVNNPCQDRQSPCCHPDLGGYAERAFMGNTATAAQSDVGSLPVEPQDNPMILRMVDWRGCSAVEYVPGRVGSHPSFNGRRIAVQGLVDWIATGRTGEEFADALRIETDSVMAAFRYLNDDPPVEVVDLTSCPTVQLNYRNVPSFRGTCFPVESLFHYLKGGKTAREFSETYQLDYEDIKTVLRHAAAQDYQGPTR